MNRYRQENRILGVNKLPMKSFFQLYKIRFGFICAVLSCVHGLSAQVKVAEPVPEYYNEIIAEEGDEGVRRYNGPLMPSISGRYWTHKHEKYFNSFEEIKADSGNVFRLYISSSDGGGIPAEIGRFINLKGLEIYCDIPIQLPTEIWQLKNLDNLIIQCYDSAMIISDSIGDLRALKRLEIRGPINQLPSSIGRLTNLEELYLYSCDFPTIPSEIGNLTNLKALVISSYGLRELPASIGNLTNLKKLQIGAKLDELPAEIGLLKQLEELNMWNTNLETLPPEIGQLKQLRMMDLNSSRLKTLPKEFGDLSQLTHLSLDGNQLEFLPDEFCRLSLLSKLDLGYNKLNALPAEFGKLTQLKEVNVNNNNLQSLPASIGDLNHIVELDAISNPLTSLPPEIMKLPQVASLNIERGGLVGIPDSVWRFINHNGCYISKVPATIAGKKLSYYLQQASIDPTAKLFVSGKLSLMYDMMSYNFYQSLDTIPDANKSFYVFVINAMLESTVIDRDGYTYYPQSEMQTICASLLVQRPCTFFKDIRHGAYQSSFQKWMETIGSLYDVYNYTVTMTDINTKLKVCGNAYLKEAQELIEPLFYSEK